MAIDEGQIFGRGVAFPPHLDSTGQWAMSVGCAECARIHPDSVVDAPGRTAHVSQLRLGFAHLFVFAEHRRHAQVDRRRNHRCHQAVGADAITIDSTSVDPDPSDPQAAIATIQYRLVANQLPNQITLTLQLQG